jgi:4-amino-4-deoxy-L-arabinose transferase-like glycosyltransferase
MPVILSIIFFSATIFLSTRKEFGNRFALVNALAFVTYGRIIFYESLHGLIDVTFSWLTYSFFMLSWHFFKRKKYLTLFLVAYSITAVSYLMKGLPSLYFTAVTLLVLFIQGKKFRMLLNWRHFLGIALLIFTVGTYYLVYFTRNGLEPGQVFDVLTGEVTRRTVVRFGVWKTILHLFTYPFENIYHFFPWSIMVILLFSKKSFSFIRQNRSLSYMMMVFLFNIIPYWTSPEAYARYILMLVPLLMTVIFALYFEYQKKRTLLFRMVDYIFGAFICVIAAGSLVFIFHPLTKDLPWIELVSVLTLLVLGIISFFYWKQPVNRLLWLAIALLVIRIAFDFSIIPSWEKTHPVVATKQLAADLAAETAGKSLYVYWNPDYKPDPYFTYRYNNEIFTFYLSTARGEITQVKTEKIPGALYLAQWEHIKDDEYIPIRKIEPAWQVPVMLIEFKDLDKK